MGSQSCATSFSVAISAIVVAGFSLTAATFPATLHFQDGRGMTPTEATPMTLPSALVSVPLADPRFMGAASGLSTPGGQLGTTAGSAVLATLMAKPARHPGLHTPGRAAPGERAAYGHLSLEQTNRMAGSGNAFVHEVASATMANRTLWPACALGCGALLVLVMLRDPTRRATPRGARLPLARAPHRPQCR